MQVRMNLSALSTLQAQFLQITGTDLPGPAGAWLEANAVKVRHYMDSLADVLYLTEMPRPLW